MSLADVRREYLGQPLSESESDPDPFAQFARWFAQVRETDVDPTAMALATATRDGRPSVRNVLLKGVDLDGNPVEWEADELQARMFQHELDHLHGVLMFDRMTPEQRREAMAEWRRLQSEAETNGGGGMRRRLRLR